MITSTVYKTHDEIYLEPRYKSILLSDINFYFLQSLDPPYEVRDFIWLEVIENETL
jgi:hypothetical protein